VACSHRHLSAFPDLLHSSRAPHGNLGFRKRFLANNLEATAGLRGLDGEPLLKVIYRAALCLVVHMYLLFRFVGDLWRRRGTGETADSAGGVGGAAVTAVCPRGSWDTAAASLPNYGFIVQCDGKSHLS